MHGTNADSVTHISRQGAERIIPQGQPTKKIRLPFYNLSSKLPGPKNTAVRIFMFSFLGTQLPMFVLMVYILMRVELTAELLTTFSIVLITALPGSASTVVALNAYPEPVNTPMAKARQQVERLCQNMRKYDWSALFPDFIPTMSIGMAEALEHDTIEKLLDRADVNLHKAKNEGRNQIVG